VFHLPVQKSSYHGAASGSKPQKFDVIICADLIFNHHSHLGLLKTCHDCLSDTGKVFIAFSHHKPQLQHRDMNFFELAKETPFNFTVTKVLSKRMTPMFEQDFGPEEVRGTVHFYLMTKQQPNSS